MALSKLQKGLVGLGIAVVAVIAVGYGGMRYLENAVVDAIRTWAALHGIVDGHTRGHGTAGAVDVHLDLMKNHQFFQQILCLHKAMFQFKQWTKHLHHVVD